MAKKRRAMADEIEIEVAEAEPEARDEGLAYVKGKRTIPNVPMRDLSGSDIDRLVYVRTIGRSRRGPVYGLRPGEAGFDEARAELVAQLIKTGIFKEGL